MSGPPSPKSLVCEEVFDERSLPSEEEVREFAIKIGIDPESETHLLPLAREGLLKPLPKNWKPVYDPKTKNYYYFNFKTKQSSWEHPLDNKYRDKVKKSRSESISSAGEDDSKTSIKEELKSFEEVGASIGLDTISSIKDNQMDFSSQGVPVLKSALSPLRSFKKDEQENFSLRKGWSKPNPRRSDPRSTFTPKPLFSPNFKDASKTQEKYQNKPSRVDWDDLSSYLDDDSEQLKEITGHRSREESNYVSPLDYNMLAHDQKVESPSSSIIGRFTVDRVRKIDIDSQTKRLDSDDSINVHRSTDRFSRSGYGRPELTLSGGGSIFLKSNKKKSEGETGAQPSSLKSLNSDYLDDPDYELESNRKESFQRNLSSSIQSVMSSPTASVSSTRSILRTPQTEKRLWDVDPQHMSVSEKALWKQQELDEEKKSVRFNLDKELNISFKLSDSSDGESSSEAGQVDEDELELNSNASEDLAMELKKLGKAKLPQSSKKEKRLSPLEEWAKETWFSKRTSLGGEKDEKEAKPNTSALGNTSQSGYSSPKFKVSENTNASTDDKVRQSQEVMQGGTEVSQESKDFRGSSDRFEPTLLSEKDFNLSDISDWLTSSTLKKSPSPVPLEQGSSEAEASFAASVTQKLKDLSTRNMLLPENSYARDIRAQEQAFRDWNVKQSDVDLYRPPLSRQQSQQQLLQIKKQIQEPAKMGDRDRALREWNVTDSVNDSVLISSPKAPNPMQLQEKNNMAKSNLGVEYGNSSNLQSMENKIEEGLKEYACDPIDKSVSALSENQTADDKLESKLEAAIKKLTLDYEIRLKGKEEEFNLKLKEDEEKLVKEYKEKFEQKIEEEAKENERKFRDSISQLERESDSRLRQIREQLEHKLNCASQKILEQHQQALAAQEVENQAAMLRVREQHSAELKILREHLQREEEQVRREHQERLVSLREDRDGKRSKDITDHVRALEKLRCEKRLVEDKYKCLKEKYIKLKGEMKANQEKKDLKQKETQQIDDKSKPSQAIAAEPEASAAQQQHQPSDQLSETESKPKSISGGSSATSNSLGFQQVQSHGLQQEQMNHVMDPPSPAPNSGPSGVIGNNNNDSNDPTVSFLGMSFCNPPFQGRHLNTNRNGMVPPQSAWCNTSHHRTERNGNGPSANLEYQQSREDFKGKLELSPLEALRHQLRTLEELEEQFPVSSVTDAYLRYPFSDSGCKELESAELEFFRHRIHLERDMIHQAKNSLQAQQSEYRSRVHNLQQRQTSSTTPSATLGQMTKEEQELSDMEAKLKRTRSILGEKIIHLRHLENSLNRITMPSLRPENNIRRASGITGARFTEKAQVKHHRRWDWKSGGTVLGIEDISDDMSSDSGGSSGFSSNEYTSDGTLGSLLSHTGSGQRFKRHPGNTVDINLSLHNLNAEISEIWNVLCKQRAAAGLGPPPLLSSQSSTWMNPASQHPTGSVTAYPGNPTVTASMSKVVSDKNSSLIERTNNLRQWLQKAKMSATSSAPRDINDGSF